MATFLVIDTETGGTDPYAHSILSLAGVVWDNGVVRACIEVKIAEPVLSLTARAMEINRIDIVSHCKEAMDPRSAVEAFTSFLRHHLKDSLASHEKIQLAGHNVGFDVGFMKRLWQLAGADFDSSFSHRVLDTAGIVRFLSLVGVLPLAGASSNEAFAHFGIAVLDAQRHTALGDARATAELLTRLVALGRKDLMLPGIEARHLG